MKIKEQIPQSWALEIYISTKNLENEMLLEGIEEYLAGEFDVINTVFPENQEAIIYYIRPYDNIYFDAKAFEEKLRKNYEQLKCGWVQIYDRNEVEI